MHHNFLFDLDQTLLDFHASEYIGLKQVITANGCEFSDEVYHYFKARNKELWLELEKGTISRPELFETRFRLVFGKCGADTSGMDLLKINDDFITEMSKNGVLMDGSLEFLGKLKENVEGARIHIVSNGATRNAVGRIRSTGMDRYLDEIFISESIGRTKPSADFFEFVMDKTGDPKDSYIVIGDSLTSDMLGAKNASLKSVWFMPQGDVAKAVKEYDIDYCASSYGELYDVLCGWGRSRIV